MHLTSLHLRNFRNYRSLDLELPAGLLVFSGANTQGKSNLLEAIYLLAIGRSPRATSEREMVGWGASETSQQAQVSATVHTAQGPVKLQVDLIGSERDSTVTGDAPAPASVQKRVRINGIPRLTADLVGQLHAVLFDASDIQLIEGAPALRRRYLDILLSQADRRYLQVLQRYHRVLTQRNRLLRLLRERRAQQAQMEFWDQEVAQQGAYLLRCRFEAVAALATFAGPTYAALRGEDGPLALEYQATRGQPSASHLELEQALREALIRGRQRELALGATLTGPHRDDLRFTAGGRALGVYGSRGERRIAAVALRLAEGEFLAQGRGDAPVVLLDDVLSELDAVRGRQVLQAIGRYSQVLLTTTAPEAVVLGPVAPAATYRVVQGTVMLQSSGG